MSVLEETINEKIRFLKKYKFEIKEQKELFSKITYILTHNTADKELEELYSVLNNEENIN